MYESPFKPIPRKKEQQRLEQEEAEEAVSAMEAEAEEVRRRERIVIRKSQPLHSKENLPDAARTKTMQASREGQKSLTTEEAPRGIENSLKHAGELMRVEGATLHKYLRRGITNEVSRSFVRAVKLITALTVIAPEAMHLAAELDPSLLEARKHIETALQDGEKRLAEAEQKPDAKQSPTYGLEFQTDRILSHTIRKILEKGLWRTAFEIDED